MSKSYKVITHPPDWKFIAEQLAQKVNFAINWLSPKGGGSGVIYNSNTNQAIYWKNSFADALELIPGVTVDREKMLISDLPRPKQKKALAELEARRAVAKKEAA